MDKVDQNLIPPTWLQTLVGGQYVKVGKAFVDQFGVQNLFEKESKILDAGCGPGRMAIHFIDKLDLHLGGELHGFDCHQASIKWASENISQKHSNFIFKHVNAYNSFYNPTGALNVPNKIVFPYENEYFDFMFSTSLFTHLTKPYTERYLKELFRVSKPGANVLATFFVSDKQPKQTSDLISSPKRSRRQKLFKYDEVSYVANLKNPSAFIVYKRNYLEKLITNIGFTILQNPNGFQAQWIFKKEE